MSAVTDLFQPLPRDMPRDAFMQLFGGVYEHSPWVAEGVWRDGLRERHDDVDGLAAAMAEVVNATNMTKRMALIKAHPDLAGRAAIAGELTAESSSEQASAGIDQCTPAEFERFTKLNTHYKRRFGMPFIIAVRGSTRHDILAAFEQRIDNDPSTEFTHAMNEIHKIARLRLAAIAEAQREERI